MLKLKYVILDGKPLPDFKITALKIEFSLPVNSPIAIEPFEHFECYDILLSLKPPVVCLSYERE